VAARWRSVALVRGPTGLCLGAELALASVPCKVPERRQGLPVTASAVSCGKLSACHPPASPTSGTGGEAHGNVFVSAAFRVVCRHLGISIQPAQLGSGAD
jgi:hypothetical protein